MVDQGVREIQLSGKQLVFLFMASVVLAVGVFLLGVSVGRGVRDATGGAPASSPETARAAEATPPVEMPPPVKPEAQDLRYHDQLQGQAAAAGVATAAAAEARAGGGPPPEATPVDEPQPTSATPEKPAATAPTNPSTKAAAKAAALAAAPATAAAGQGWTVQTGAFRSQDNANKQAADLKKAGMPAVVVAGAQNALFSVRVGPYAQRAEAERVLARLKAQFPGAAIAR